MPQVLSMKHCPGRAVPEGAVYIGDAMSWRPYRLRRSKWRNPFKIDKIGSRASNNPPPVNLVAILV